MKIAQKRRGTGSASERLRHDIDSGRTGDKVSGPDPSATPLGTDDEAAGTAPDLDALSRARADEDEEGFAEAGSSSIAIRPRQSQAEGSLAFMGAVLAVLALLLVGLFIAS